jgi:hypothetical protein
MMEVVSWRVFGVCSNLLKDMVGPWGLEPQTFPQITEPLPTIIRRARCARRFVSYAKRVEAIPIHARPKL